MGLNNAYTITNISVSEGHITDANVTFNKTANGYRLPTEAEWEYAARGGAKATEAQFKYFWSGATTENYYVDYNKDFDVAGWYWYNIKTGTTDSTDPAEGDPGYGTHQVGKKSPNAAGLYDMSGNVGEWCYDEFNETVTINDNAFMVNGVVTDPLGPSDNQDERVWRGGCWNSYSFNCAVSYREFTSNSRDYYGEDISFRIVRNAQ